MALRKIFSLPVVLHLWRLDFVAGQAGCFKQRVRHILYSLDGLENCVTALGQSEISAGNEKTTQIKSLALQQRCLTWRLASPSVSMKIVFVESLKQHLRLGGRGKCLLFVYLVF
jgi:hypothetical protein